MKSCLPVASTPINSVKGQKKWILNFCLTEEYLGLPALCQQMKQQLTYPSGLQDDVFSP